MTWQEALTRLDQVMEARNYAATTRTGYRLELGQFIRFAAQHGIENPTDVTRELVSQYQNALCTQSFRGKPLSANTRMNRLVALKMLFRILTEEGFIIIDPASRVKLPRIRNALPRRILSPKEVEQILDQPVVSTLLGLRNRAILELLYSTGIRNQELRTLRMKDIDLERSEARVWGKGSKPRVVPIGSVAASFLVRYLSQARPKLLRGPSEFVFLSRRGGEPLSCRGLIDIVLVAARGAKLRAYKQVTPHVFRHSCATHLLRAQAPLRAIQELLGHTSLQSTQIYTRVEISDLKAVHARCHPREKGPQWIFPKQEKDIFNS